MEEHDWLVERFEASRARLKAVAYRMLGSLSEADDAVQEAWLRLGRADTGEVDNLGGWLTTVVARVCLNTLRSRKSRREEALGSRVPSRSRTRRGRHRNPEHEALLADSVGLALLVVLETLTPAERLAFVLHDMFAVPFEEIAPSSTARLPRPGSWPAAPAAVCAARPSRMPICGPAGGGRRLFAAAREGDFDRLVAVLDPEVVLHADFGPSAPRGRLELHGVEAVTKQARTFRGLVS